MYAIFKKGSKQYRVAVGDIIDVDLFDANEGDEVEFSDVLFVNDGKASMVGNPTVAGYVIAGKALGKVKGDKVIAFKFKRRKNYHRKIGHRQKYSRIEITSIKTKDKGK